MPRWPKKDQEESKEVTKTVTKEASVGQSELAAAIVAAVQATKPIEKKNPFNRKVTTPWTPKDGSKKLKLKRKMYQHGLLINEETLSNQEVDLCNKVRIGDFCDGYVKIKRRRDRGVDIDYQVKTASQRLRLVNQFGVRNLSELLLRCIEEANAPKKVEFDPDGDAL